MLETFNNNNEGKVTVANTSTSVLAANDDRKYLRLSNDSNEAIYISLGGTAVLNEGIRLAPADSNGSVLELNASNMFIGAVKAICSSGGKNLSYSEA